MNARRSPQARASQLSLCIHLLLVLAWLLCSRYAVNPETPPLVIDFSLAAVNTAHAETGPPAGGEATKPQPSPAPTPATPPEVTKDPPPSKPALAPKKVVKPTKTPRKPHPVQPKPEHREVATSVPVDQASAQDSTELATTAHSSMANDESVGGRQIEGLGAPSAGGAGGASANGREPGGEGGGIPYSYEYVRRLIINNLRFPSIARKMGLSGKIVVAFTLQHDGQVADIAITSSSGHAILDDEVAATLRRIAPLPRPPTPARLVVPIVFNLRQ